MYVNNLKCISLSRSKLVHFADFDFRLNGYRTNFRVHSSSNLYKSKQNLLRLRNDINICDLNSYILIRNQE